MDIRVVRVPHSWRSSALFGLWRHWCAGAIADGIGHEVGMGAKAVAGAFDVDDDGMVEQAAEQGGGDDGVAEDFALFGEAAV